MSDSTPWNRSTRLPPNSLLLLLQNIIFFCPCHAHSCPKAGHPAIKGASTVQGGRPGIGTICLDLGHFDFVRFHLFFNSEFCSPQSRVSTCSSQMWEPCPRCNTNCVELRVLSPVIRFSIRSTENAATRMTS